MRQFSFLTRILCGAFLLIHSASATTLDVLGFTLLRTIDPTLTGTGITVAQPEAPQSSSDFEVNPLVVGQPANLFTFYSSSGTSSNYPNGVGTESGHADGVGGNFYGTDHGSAPGIAHVDNYEATYFYESIVITGVPINAKIVNQSFIFDDTPPQSTVDLQYDNYAAQNNVLFISGVGNSGSPGAPATSYNGIGVGALGGASSLGPTSDGRSKPDLTAPADATSFSTPYVAGAAAILRQAALRGDAGAGTTNAASDARTVKAFLLNGAIKPNDWTHMTTAPLDPRYGSGILNVFNSYKELAAGKFSYVETTTNPLPLSFTANVTNISSRLGWDFNSITNSLNLSTAVEKVNHYYFNVDSNNFSLNATLVWNRRANQNSPNNLDLLLYSLTTSNVVASSVSTVDNLEHLFVTNLVAGRYDLQVIKRAPSPPIFLSETYALAFEFFAVPLTIVRSETNVILSWPLSPTGFRIESTPNLNSPVTWSSVAASPVVTNNENRVTLIPTEAAQFFRLARP